MASMLSIGSAAMRSAAAILNIATRVSVNLSRLSSSSSPL
jgi:hypothetical protein